MKKTWKILLITLVSILLLIGIVSGYALWFVSNPQKLSPVINNQVRGFFNCDVNIGKVELTFFRTFPDFQLQLSDFSLVNPMENADSDTLVHIERLSGKLDIQQFRRNNNVVLSGISLTNGTINAFIDSLGKTNFDVLVLDEDSEAETTDEFGFNTIDLGKIDLKNINIRFRDDSLQLFSSIKNLHAEIQGKITQDLIDSELKMKDALVSFAMNGDTYLKDAAVNLHVPAKIVDFGEAVELNGAWASLNGLLLNLDGRIENDQPNGGFLTQLTYSLREWQIETLMDLIPESFNEMVEGIQMKGLITSSGTISGLLTDSIFPLMDINLTMKNGSLSYPDFPLPLDGMNGDLAIFTDLADDSQSFVQIHEFNAKTPLSSFSVKGKLTNILSDLYADIAAQGNFVLQEFQPMIPDTIPLEMKGRARGNVNMKFAMSDLDEMRIEKMNITGRMTGTDIDMVYDSLWVKSDFAELAFAIPNPNPTSEKTSFSFADFKARSFATGKIADYEAYLLNPAFTIELSDPRDTTRLPDIFCRYQLEDLQAAMDTISVWVTNPAGQVTLSPRENFPLQPHILLAYQGDALSAIMGSDSLMMGKAEMDIDITNDADQEDIFLQWLARGFINMQEGWIKSQDFTHNLHIPSVQMEFEPERFEIKESRMVINQSDFELSGVASNILSYIRGDSLLRGEFQFRSENTDLLELMNLTSGLGREEDELEDEETSPIDQTASNDGQAEEESFSEPYMVPKGIDFVLDANITKATFGVDTAHNIRGAVRVSDGILLLDQVSFATSAARMQLTAMYRTPRKNHLFLGLNYHMMDIEIERLLQMIPDIDTLMPMLRSFRGKGEFHLAVETYLDSLYEVKKSTLRGAASIRGQNLVLMDGETFSEIARTLRFSRRAENIVDSLSAEFTIFREEIDIYPFLISMDRYKAVVAGRHNFDMSFNYHITVVDSPLPVRLGLDIQGNPDNMRFSLASTRYPEFYRPTSRRAVESRQLELRRMIREALTDRVIDP